MTASPPTEGVAVALGNLLRALEKTGDTIMEGHRRKCSVWAGMGCNCSIAARLSEARKALDEYSPAEPGAPHPVVQVLEDLNIPNLLRVAKEHEERGEQRIPCFLQLEWVERAAEAMGYSSPTKEGGL